MRCLTGRIALPALLALLAAACTADSELKPFTSDGCSLFPDSSPIGSDDWCDCCFVHDIAYWKGGTADERKAADERLRDCVAEKTGDRKFASMMYDGVRFGGSPYFYNWYRWGYGWGYERKYQELTPEEVGIAQRLLAEYEATGARGVCAEE